MTAPTSHAGAEPAADPILLRRRDGKVLTLTLNRPRAGNALSLAMIAALQAALDESADDDGVHVIVLESTGDRVFCAGHDLKEMQAARQAPDAGAAHFNTLFTACAEMMQRITSLPQPVIAEALWEGR